MPLRDSTALIPDAGGHTGRVEACALGPNGAARRSLKLRYAASVEVLSTLASTPAALWATTLASTEGLVLSASTERTLKLSNAGSGVELWTLQGHTAWACAPPSLRRGASFASASTERTLKLWTR
jgi:hypothetical protein